MNKDEKLIFELYKNSRKGILKEAWTADDSGTLQGIPDDIANAKDPARKLDELERTRPVATSKLSQRTGMNWQPKALREYQKQLADILSKEQEPYDQLGATDVAFEDQETVVTIIGEMIKSLEQLKSQAENADMEESYDELADVIERLT